MSIFRRNADLADSFATDSELRDAVKARREAQREAESEGDYARAERMREATDRALDHLNLRD
ncbi:hypothetical protein [Streptomyces smyrnaeus]|uniref:hypothetical protein n=1 Tax=Streptomyces smyrnaeus TaxID=1387713 RepID=UPI0033E0A007